MFSKKGLNLVLNYRNEEELCIGLTMTNEKLSLTGKKNTCKTKHI